MAKVWNEAASFRLSPWFHVSANQIDYDPETEDPRSHCGKRRCVVVYSEPYMHIGREEVTSIQDVFAGLSGCLTALILLFCAGWVHRDVSCGNVLLCRDSHWQGRLRGRLADLEHARKFPSGTSPPYSMTGTSFFLPAEIGLGLYLGRPAAAGKRGRSTDASPERRRRDAELKPEQKVMRIQKDDVQHHFTHDLESLWWIVIWMVTFRMGRWDLVQWVFLPNVNFNNELRMDYVCTPRRLYNIGKCLPNSVCGVYWGLEEARRYFAASYYEWTKEGVGRLRHREVHMDGYAVMRRVVEYAFPKSAPALVKRSSVYEGGEEIGEEDERRYHVGRVIGVKRSRSDSSP